MSGVSEGTDAGASRGLPRGSLSNVAINRPVGTLSQAAVVLVLGLFFLERLPIDLLPRIDYPQIRVTVNYPGVSPQVIEEQVTRVLEQNMAATENVVRILSQSAQGRSDVDLIFEYGTDLDLALQDASRQLDRARVRLPVDIEPPRLRRFDPAQAPIWQAGFSSSVRSEADVREWIDNRLTPQLLSVPGVANVEATGGMVREIQVVVDQERLRAYGLSLQQVADALARENVDIAGGWVTSERFDVLAQIDGRFASAADIGQLLLSLPVPGGGSQQLRLADVAEVTEGHRRQRVWARLNARSATQVSVFKQPQANTLEITDNVQAALLRLRDSGFIPADIEFRPVSDRSFFIRGSVAAVGGAALLGGSLAMLMVFLFLGSLRRSFVIGLSLPIALMATFALMGVGGLTLNIISLGGLALGVGLLLDNAIVMLENISRHRQELGKSSLDAAHDGSREVISAVTAGTLTNLAAVLPFLLVSGLAAMLFRELIVTISFAILATLAAAVTLVPMLAAQLGRVRASSGLAGMAPLRLFDAGIGRLRRLYRRTLPRVLRWRWAVLAVAVALVGLSVQRAGQLGQEFLPAVDDGNLSVLMRLPTGTPPQETLARARAVETVLREQPHVESVFSIVGGNLFGGIVNERPGTARFSVQLVPASQRPQTSASQWMLQTRQALDSLALSDTRLSIRPPAIPGLWFTATGSDLSVGVVGDDVQQLREVAREVLARLRGIEGLEGLEVGNDDENPLLSVEVDRDRAAGLGLRVSEVGRAVRDAVDGAVPTRFISGGREVDVRVRLPDDAVSDAQALGELIVFGADGQPVSLRDVARFALGDSPATIERENQVRLARVNADIDTGRTDVAAVMRQVRERLADLRLPEGVSLTYGGQWESIQETNRNLALVIALALFLVFVVLAVQYEKLSNPLVILSAAPASLVGVVAALTLTGTPLSAPVLIGVVLLVGIVVNNAILLVELIEIGRRAGLSRARAVVRAGTVRLRPILMTTSTTVLGMLPLAIGLGEGADIMRPLALAVVGGLSVSMLLTLGVVPCLYLIVSQVAEGTVRRLTGAPRAGATGTASA